MRNADAQHMRRSGREEDLFSAALALPVAERTCYLKRACAEDRGLLDRLQQLLDAATEASNFIKEQDTDAPFERAGDWIGRYRLIEELGEGGCAVVYLAEQSHPIRRHVALKLIKPGMDTRALISRFEAEQQALAVMDHPHIAKVFDAGIAPTGRPYFAMELVRGIRLTDYCNHSRLTVSERLLLFNQVCRAIQHAHRKGIIHRDIKPSNVLVTMHDGVPVAKVIDFGLAKAMQERSVVQAAPAAPDLFIGTPAYMSPEQIQPHQPEVDTRSDIYSLGVLLYELLTGVTPFDPVEQLQSRLDLFHRIQAEAPRKPSDRLEAMGDALSGTATSAYGATAARLLKQVRGDLDCIVMRCLEKEPDRRYQTPGDLQLDVERHLRHEIVLARPPSLVDTVGRFAQRHRMMFGASLAGVAFIAFLIGFAITVTQQARRISLERDRAEQARLHAEQVSDVILHILSAADPFENFSYEIPGSEVLDQVARTLQSQLGSATQVGAKLLEGVGRAYRRRGDADNALIFLGGAVEAWSRIDGGDEAARIGAMVELSIAQRMNGDLQRAQQVIGEAEERARRHGLGQSLVYARLLVNRARNDIEASNLPRARQDLQTSLQISRAHAGPNSKEVADALLTQALLLQWTDEFPESERAARESLRIFETTVAPMHPDRVLAETRVAEVLYMRQRIHAAELLFEEALRKNIQLFGNDSWPVADVLDSLSKVRRSQGRFDEAEDLARRAIAAQSARAGEGHPNILYLRTSLAALLIERGKYVEAERELRQALVAERSTVPALDGQYVQYVASAEYLLGEVLLATDRLSEAENVLIASIERWQRSGAPPWRAARSASALGEALYRQGRVREAKMHLIESNREISAAPGAGIEDKIRASERVARFLQRFGDATRLDTWSAMDSNTRA